MIYLSKASNLTVDEKFRIIMNENKPTGNDDKIRKGWIYETVCIILILCKCFTSLQYDKLYSGQLQNPKVITHCKKILDILIAGGGNNIADFLLTIHDCFVAFSIKYKDKYDNTDISAINDTVSTQGLLNGNYRYALILKDKNTTLNHNFTNKARIDKKHIDEILKNNLLFDETDVVKALGSFFNHSACLFNNNEYGPIDETMEIINKQYLLSNRKHLIQKTHQALALIKMMELLNNTNHNQFCFAHKPRSGKSIIILLVCLFLLESGYADKILIMTSVPATIDSFIQTLDEFINFKNIQYRQLPRDTLEPEFKGIVFCSVQYLKADKHGHKKYLLKKTGFKVIITDEAHQGGSTYRTKTSILEVNKNDNDKIRKNIKIHLFVSGTADRTRKYYGIPHSCVFEWETEDEAYMKRLAIPDDPEMEENIRYMVNRHGPIFKSCYENVGFDRDYSKCPTQVLMKINISQGLINAINDYNAENKANFGYNCGSIFALKQSVNEKGKKIYLEEFELEQTNKGIAILKWFLEIIYSTDPMKQDTVMNQIEQIQTDEKSRISTTKNPLLFILYLPTHTGNGSIVLLQRTLKRFLETQNLWNEFNIEYSNSMEDTGFVKEEYNSLIQTFMDRTKKEKKQGCILLLGNKGSVGITYHHCDATISLDDGHCLDNQKQRYSRALTEAKGKTVGINVDMNIQRTYKYLLDIIHKHRKFSKSNVSNAEVLQYLFRQKIFLFITNQQALSSIKFNTKKLLSFYQTEADHLRQIVDEDTLLDYLECEDDLRKFIHLANSKQTLLRKHNPDLDGDQPDCPKGDKDIIEIDGQTNSQQNPVVKNTDEEDDDEIEPTGLFINKTLEICKTFIPMIAFMARSFHLLDYKEIFTNEITKPFIFALMREKKIDIDENSQSIIIQFMNKIIDDNTEIINNIREIYNTAPPEKLRKLIEKHFIPTVDEKKRNAEVPTPVVLVDEMLNYVPPEFWMKPHKVFEPCCGKGNFVLGIFDKFYLGLEKEYPDKKERCLVILQQCIYYADLTNLNVFITTELLKCHAQYFGCEILDFHFNQYTGDTLKMDIQYVWGIQGFDLVYGNPPYNSSGDTATGNTIWQEFTKKSLNKWIFKNGYLLFVHPPGWRKPNTEKGKFTKMFDLMTKENQLLYLEIHGIKDGQKTFQCGTRYDWYLIKKTSVYKNSIIIDEIGERIELDLREMSWLPNSNIIEIQNFVAKNGEDTCPIIQSMSAYEPRKKWMSQEQTAEFKYPCIHSTPKGGTRFKYSKVNDRGHFGVSKVIFGESGIYKPVIDMEGKYGMTQGAMAIQVNNLEEATFISKVIESDRFDKIIQSCIFSSFRIDWNIFKTFKKDFWKAFI